jgi:hypothetical protein
MALPTIIERFDAHRCCARCGIEPKEVRKYGKRCFHWGVVYDSHFWIDWEPAVGLGQEARSS